MTSKMPEWIKEGHLVGCEAPSCTEMCKMRTALEIAWEAHLSISKNGCCDKCQEAKLVSLQALSSIRALGGK